MWLDLVLISACVIFMATGTLAVIRYLTIQREYETLREREESMRKVVAGARCILWDAIVSEITENVYDWQFKTFGSDAIRRDLGLTGKNPGEDAKAWVKGIPPEDLKKMDETASTALRNHAHEYTQEFKLPDGKGGFRYFREEVQINMIAMRKWHLIGVQMEVTEIKRAQREATRHSRYLETLMQNIPDHVYFKDWEGRFVFVNPAVVKHLGAKSAADVIGKTDLDFQEGDVAAIYRIDEQKIIESGEAQINKLQGRKGEWLLISKVPIYDASGTALGVVGISRDVTEIKEAQEALGAMNDRLEKLVREDSLTGLLNRPTLLDLLDKEWLVWLRYGNVFSVMMIDADNFKQVNDNHGHLVGDRVLKILGNVMSGSVRSVDVAGRYGGEEFLIILPQTDAVGALSAAQNLLENIRKSKFEISPGVELNLTVSIGVAAVTRDDLDVEALLSRADKALYAAKHAGKDRVVADEVNVASA